MPAVSTVLIEVARNAATTLSTSMSRSRRNKAAQATTRITTLIAKPMRFQPILSPTVRLMALIAFGIRG